MTVGEMVGGKIVVGETSSIRINMVSLKTVCATILLKLSSLTSFFPYCCRFQLDSESVKIGQLSKSQDRINLLTFLSRFFVLFIIEAHL